MKRVAGYYRFAQDIDGIFRHERLTGVSRRQHLITVGITVSGAVSVNRSRYDSRYRANSAGRRSKNAAMPSANSALSAARVNASSS